jgi:hypothetical protein
VNELRRQMGLPAAIATGESIAGGIFLMPAAMAGTAVNLLVSSESSFLG